MTNDNPVLRDLTTEDQRKVTSFIDKWIGSTISEPAITESDQPSAHFDNGPTWDNMGPSFDNRPTWDNWDNRG